MHGSSHGSGPVPVIVGIGELTDKPERPEQGIEPLEILERCARLAEQDVGYRCLRRVDTLRVVSQISWRYSDLPGLLARRLRIRSPETIYGPPGGESPVRMLVDAAVDIASGDSEIALLCGAEALKSAFALRVSGRPSSWTPEDPDVVLPAAEDYVSRYAARYGLVNPVEVYPLYENAIRSAWNLSAAEAQAESAAMWEQMSHAAAQNPHAWSGRHLTAQEIVTPTARNRPIAYPYRKLQVAQIGVNQGAAVILTHLEAARSWGIPEHRLIYVWSGAGAQEPADFLKRDAYTHSSAMERVLRRALEVNRLHPKDIDLFELYSCFPCVPKLARRALSLTPQTPVSVTGGLSFFGGPGNNYMTHAITAMVRALRTKGEGTGLLYGNGEFVTKHHAAVLATAPPAEPPANTNLQDQVDAAYAPVPALLEEYTGPCTIETYTVTYTEKGTPDRGTVIARTPAGQRFLARVTSTQPTTLQSLVDETAEPVGRTGYAYDAQDGLIHFALQLPSQVAERPLLFEKVGPHIAVVTLNRPDRRNTINGAVTRLMVDYLARIEADPEIRVAILTAAGDTAFCGGADLWEVAAGHAYDMVDHLNGFAGLVNARRSKPWIAAVRGAAAGGGMEVILACDLVIAGESASFSLPEVRRGLLAAAGGVYRLPRTIPPRKAMEYLLTGATLSASDADSLQLVNRVVPDGDLLDAALELAHEIAANAPLAVGASRKLAAATFDTTDARLSQRSLDDIAVLMSGEDAREGVRAFLEKRPARWRGT
ncbi:MAG TPA: enoyl-CoA hydratase-related protein [Steroidobacteraceae bacterium]|nr:enoyl-CoA hydratase-related protein [Steroidobacteraceae bacterium]